MTARFATYGRLTSYEYDQLGRMTRIVYPKDGGTTLIWDEYYQYDSRGNLVAKLQGTVSSGLVTEGAVTVYAYDALSRLQYVEYDRYDGFSAGDKHWPVAPGDLALSGGDVSYTYDGGSDLKTQMVDSAGTSQYGYDALGRLTSYTPPKPSGFQTWYSVAYQYNNLGQKTQMTLTTPSSAQKVTKYLYFRDGSLKDVRWPTSTWPPTLMTQYTYYKNGPRNLTAYGQLSGEGWYHTSRTYNARGEMTGIKHRHSNQLVGGTQWNQERIAEVVYGLDAGGNPLRIDEYYDAAGSYHRSAYGYDALGRLTGWTFGGDTKGWTYDWVGNWLTSSDGTFVTDPDVDWLDSSPAPSATYDYTKLGALEDMTVSANTDTFSYDPQELLSQVSYGGGGSSTMTWDADQQRQKLTNSGGSTYFVYDPTAGVPAVLVETDGENETFYVREPGGELIARATGQTRQYYFFDRLGSTIAMVPAVEGNPTDRLFYTPWGELVTSGSRASTVGTTANPYRYVGSLGYYYHHQDANLADWMQLGVRFYQPELGRFERIEPVSSTDDESAYVYSGDSPVAYIDFDGESKVKIIAKTVKGLAKKISRESAVKIMRRGGDVAIEKRKGLRQPAKQIARQAFGKKGVIHSGRRQSPHNLPHGQHKTGKGGHIYYTRTHVPWSNIGVIICGDNIVGEAADFFNPLGDVEEVINIVKDPLGWWNDDEE